MRTLAWWNAPSLTADFLLQVPHLLLEEVVAVWLDSFVLLLGLFRLVLHLNQLIFDVSFVNNFV